MQWSGKKSSTYNLPQQQPYLPHEIAEKDNNKIALEKSLKFIKYSYFFLSAQRIMQQKRSKLGRKFYVRHALWGIIQRRKKVNN